MRTSIINFLESLIEAFKSTKPTAAQVAKERLQIIVSHESTRHRSEDFIRDLQNELLEVISKYVNIDRDMIKVQLEQHGDQSVLELNVTLNEAKQPAALAATESVEAQA
jgi:cell division topological specificity factor